MSASATVTRVVAVQGGGIDPSAVDCGNAWILQPTLTEGKQFAEIYTGQYHCKQFLGNNFKMVNCIKRLRNAKVVELMSEVDNEEDPNEDHPLQKTRLPKRELIDRIPPIVTIDVATHTMRTSVNVLPSWRVGQVLQIELTEANLDLLLEEPAESAPWAPTIQYESMCWVGTRNALKCTWWDSKKRKYRHKWMPVLLSSDMDDEDKDRAVAEAANELQHFRDKIPQCIG